MAAQFTLREKDAPARAPARPSRQHFVLDDQRHGLTRRSTTSGVETRTLKPVSGYPLTIPGAEIPETLDLSGVCYRALAGGDPFANLRRWAAHHIPLHLTWVGDRGRPQGDLWLVVQVVENDEMYLEGLWQVRRWRLQLTRIPAGALAVPAPTPVPPEETEDFGPLPEPTNLRLNPAAFGIFPTGYVLLRWDYSSDKVDYWEYRYGPAGGDYGSPLRLDNPAARSLQFQYRNSGGVWFYTPLQLQLAAGSENKGRQPSSDWVAAPVFYQPAPIPGVQYVAYDPSPTANNALDHDAIFWDERPVEDSGVAFIWQHRVWAVGSPNPTEADWRPVTQNRYVAASNLRIPDPDNPGSFLPLTAGVDYYFQVRALSQARPALHDPGGRLIAYGRTKFTAK